MSSSLTIRGAQLVLPDRVVSGDLRVDNGMIEAIGPHLEDMGEHVIDAQGLTLLPGGIDALQQIPLNTNPRVDADTLATASATALRSGLTSIAILDPHGSVTSVDGLHDALEQCARDCRTHYAVYLSATPQNLEVLNSAERTPAIHVALHPDRLDDAQLEPLFEGVDRLVVASVLSPNRVHQATTANPAEHAARFPASAAAEVVQRFTRLATTHGRHLHLTGVSTRAELDVIASSPAHVTAQARVLHMMLNASEAYEALGTRAVTRPPLREHDDVTSLWDAAASGALSNIVSSHRGVLAQAKDLPYPATPPGMPSADLLLPSLLDAVALGRLTLPDVARLLSSGPAERLGLHRKGRLEVGYDADMVLVDLDLERTVTAPTTPGPHWSPLDGHTLQGWPVEVFLLGRPVFRDDGTLIDGLRGRELTTVHA